MLYHFYDKALHNKFLWLNLYKELVLKKYFKTSKTEFTMPQNEFLSRVSAMN